jgi:hypothetical protein
MAPITRSNDLVSQADGRSQVRRLSTNVRKEAHDVFLQIGREPSWQFPGVSLNESKTLLF